MDETTHKPVSKVVVRRVDPDFVRSLRGKYGHRATETADEGRRADREEKAEREERNCRARGLLDV